MKTPLQTDNAPAAIGPYSQAQVVRLHGGNRMVFTSGQIPLDPKSGKIVGDEVKAQTRQVFKNLTGLLGAAGLSLADIVKTTVYLADMSEFKAMNEVYATFFDGDPPARTTIQAAGLPMDVRVEIDAVAIGRDF